MAETSYTLPTPTTPDDESDAAIQAVIMTGIVTDSEDDEDLDIMHTLSAEITAETEEPVIHTDSEMDDEKSTIKISIKQFQKSIVCLDDQTPEIKSLEQQRQTVKNMQQSARRLSIFFLMIASAMLVFSILVCADIIRFGLAIGMAIMVTSLAGFITARFYCYRGRKEITRKCASEIYQTLGGKALYFHEDETIKTCEYSIDYGYDNWFNGAEKMEMALIHDPVVNITEGEIVCRFEEVKNIKYEKQNRGDGDAYFVNVCYEEDNYGEDNDEKIWKSQDIKDHGKFNAVCKRLETVIKNVDPEWLSKIGITRDY